MPRVLIVEDEPKIAETLIFALQREGFEVDAISLGQQAIECARNKVPDLVLLDVGLPDCSGFDVCKAIRAHSDVPIIFLTARGDEIDRVVGLEIGADDYVVKPFSPREVLARVRTILKRRPAGARSRPSPGETIISVDRDRATASFCGQQLELTRYEYLLVALLAERPGKVYSRAEIMDALWPAASGSMDRTVDTHVKTLRAKLRRIDPRSDPLRTHRGLGYSLAAQ